MQIPKIKVLADAGAVRKVEAVSKKKGGWVVWITYSHQDGKQREALERQRGGVRRFATLDAVANTLAVVGLRTFRVKIKHP